MSYHGANFPRKLTWEWVKNQFHYCLPLSNYQIERNSLSLTSKTEKHSFFERERLQGKQ